jgi:integrase
MPACPPIEGQLLANWREFRELSQEKLGAALKPAVQKNAIHNWERGASSMSVRNLLRVVSALHVPGADDAKRLSRFFLGPDETALASGYLREAWLAACAAAGVSGRIRHDFRRTAARDMLRAGVSVPTVMRAIGWRSEAMLRRYAIVSDGDLQEAGAKRARLPR